MRYPFTISIVLEINTGKHLYSTLVAQLLNLCGFPLVTLCAVKFVGMFPSIIVHVKPHHISNSL